MLSGCSIMSNCVHDGCARLVFGLRSSNFDLFSGDDASF